MWEVVLGKKRTRVKNDQKKCPKHQHKLLGLLELIYCILLHGRQVVLATKVKFFESGKHLDPSDTKQYIISQGTYRTNKLFNMFITYLTVRCRLSSEGLFYML